MIGQLAQKNENGTSCMKGPFTKSLLSTSSVNGGTLLIVTSGCRLQTERISTHLQNQ